MKKKLYRHRKTGELWIVPYEDPELDHSTNEPVNRNLTFTDVLFPNDWQEEGIIEEINS